MLRRSESLAGCRVGRPRLGGQFDDLSELHQIRRIEMPRKKGLARLFKNDIVLLNVQRETVRIESKRVLRYFSAILLPAKRMPEQPIHDAIVLSASAADEHRRAVIDAKLNVPYILYVDFMRAGAAAQEAECKQRDANT